MARGTSFNALMAGLAPNKGDLAFIYCLCVSVLLLLSGNSNLGGNDAGSVGNIEGCCAVPGRTAAASPYHTFPATVTGHIPPEFIISAIYGLSLYTVDPTVRFLCIFS